MLGIRSLILCHSKTWSVPRFISTNKMQTLACQQYHLFWDLLSLQLLCRWPRFLNQSAFHMYQKINYFRGIDPDDLDLWQTEVAIRDNDSLPQIPYLNKKLMLSGAKKIAQVFWHLPEEHIHIIVKAPCKSEVTYLAPPLTLLGNPKYYYASTTLSTSMLTDRVRDPNYFASLRGDISFLEGLNQQESHRVGALFRQMKPPYPRWKREVEDV